LHFCCGSSTIGTALLCLVLKVMTANLAGIRLREKNTIESDAASRGGKRHRPFENRLQISCRHTWE